MGHVRGRAALVIFVFALAIGGFQNCSDPMQADGTQDTYSSLSTPTPTPVPISGSYFPNPATVGAAITISGMGGIPPYTFVKTSGNGTLNGQIYTAPATAEIATITIVDTTGHSFPVSIQVYVANPSPSPSPSASPSPSPTPSQYVPVYRFFNSTTYEHFFTLDRQDSAANGFNPEGIGFYVLRQAATGTVGLYRCRISTSGLGGRHFVSLDRGCEGQTYESTYGYVYSTQVTGTVQLYRVYSIVDHIATKNPNEGQAQGYKPEGSLGFVPNM